MQFDFGRNWQEFSLRKLDESAIQDARADFLKLLEGVAIEGRSFLDIGFGQGLSLLNAASLGANAVGCDIDPICAQVLRRNARNFPTVSEDQIPLIIGSILEPKTIRQIRALLPQGFDIVHSWGVLHHTGDLWKALQIASSFVAPGGHFVIAIYNRHWSSPAWRPIKHLYCALSNAGRRCLVAILYPLIWTAKLVATGQDPKIKSRGMDFYYDAIDWIGGYPYEFASAKDVCRSAEEAGFKCLSIRPPRVPTGCNEFLFRRLDT